ncbi:hypothetical protein T11_10 [Trichinella zimbabwensis]|uniref:Uncharacterized protein n=1 Tax=Trichinella zimbabwensis TaxID=268475 RepID=A0A0V1GTQ0_9BILA|nr:hypothetical protein T11_10 [Trichinella zimbabwensis]
MRAKLFKGKPPQVRQNSGGVDFVERKRHGAKRKPPSYWGKVAPGRTKFSWCGYCGRETTRGRKRASIADGVKAAEAACGGKMRAKLFKGKLPLVRENSGGVDFVEGKHHRAAKKPPSLFCFCEEKGTWRKNACKVVWGKAAKERTKFLWCGFCGEKTGRCRKEAYKVVLVKAALGRKNGRGGSFGEKTTRGGKMRSKLFGGKPPRDGQNSGGVDFVEKKRHGAEKKPPRRKLHVAGKCRQSCSGKVTPRRTKFSWCGFCGRETTQGRKKASIADGVKADLVEKMEEELVDRKRHWGRQNVGDILWRKGHVAEKCGQSCLGKVAPGQTKFSWCCFCGEETARG